MSLFDKKPVITDKVITTPEPVLLPPDDEGIADVQVTLPDGRRCYPVRVNTRLVSPLGQEEILEVIKREL